MLDHTTLNHLRLQHPFCKYPALYHYDLGHLWPAPGMEARDAKYTDFHPALLLGVIKHLRGHKMPHERADGLNAIKNQIQLLTRDEGDASALWLATHYEVGLEIWQRQNNPGTRPAPVAVTDYGNNPLLPPPPGQQRSEEELAATRAAIEAAKRSLPERLGGGA
jgi:hypothetical protein